MSGTARPPRRPPMDLDARSSLIDARAVVPHTDADGLAAGAIALRARGEDAARAVLLPRGTNPFQHPDALPPGPLAILDWGVRPFAEPALFVDHHAPEGDAGPGSVLVSGYGEQPQTTTAALLRRIVPEAPSWLAAVGAVGDLGDDGFALPEALGVPKAAVRALVPLVNAPRRVADGPVRTALALLVESADPKEALADPRVRELEEARAVWRAAFAAAIRTPPRFYGDVAVVRISSGCQIHPLLAATWRRRLEPRVVIAANDGYVPGRVNFAVRGGDGLDLRTLLRRALPEATGELGNGHDAATGGSLPPDEFDLLLRRLGART